MASTVFGTPITTSYLTDIKKVKLLVIMQEDRARAAMEMKNVEGKDIAARNFVKQLHQEFGREKDNTTMCLVYNATGDPVTFCDSMFSDGEICESPCPLVIANGQWGAFLCGPYGDIDCDATTGAFTYKGRNCNGNDVYWVTALYNSSKFNSIWGEIRPTEHNYSLKTLKKKLSTGNDNCAIDNAEDVAMYASIGGGRTPIFEAILTLPDVLRDN